MLKDMKSKKNNLSAKDYEQLGRTIETIFESGYLNNRFRVYKMSLIRGIFFGLGIAIGGSFVVACVIWIMSLFTELPLIGNLVETIKDSIQNR